MTSIANTNSSNYWKMIDPILLYNVAFNLTHHFNVNVEASSASRVRAINTVYKITQKRN